MMETPAPKKSFKELTNAQKERAYAELAEKCANLDDEISGLKRKQPTEDGNAEIMRLLHQMQEKADTTAARHQEELAALQRRIKPEVPTAGKKARCKELHKWTNKSAEKTYNAVLPTAEHLEAAQQSVPENWETNGFTPDAAKSVIDKLQEGTNAIYKIMTNCRVADEDGWDVVHNLNGDDVILEEKEEERRKKAVKEVKKKKKEEEEKKSKSELARLLKTVSQKGRNPNRDFTDRRDRPNGQWKPRPRGSCHICGSWKHFASVCPDKTDGGRLRQPGKP